MGDSSFHLSTFPPDHRRSNRQTTLDGASWLRWSALSSARGAPLYFEPGQDETEALLAPKGQSVGSYDAPY